MGTNRIGPGDAVGGGAALAALRDKLPRYRLNLAEHDDGSIEANVVRDDENGSLIKVEELDAALVEAHPQPEPVVTIGTGMVLSTERYNQLIDAELDRLRAVEAHPPDPPPQWQPIETMPRTGYFIIIWDGGDRALIRWTYAWDCWRNIEEYVNLPNRVDGWWCSMKALPDPPSLRASSQETTDPTPPPCTETKG